MLLPQEVLKELGVKEETKKALEETLIAWLRDKEILIILDNCEHLIETCALLTEKLLKACPKLKIIATSREPMKCTGEQTHNILSLEIPNLKEEVSAEQLTQFESVRLFIERALAVKPGFRVNNENAPALAGICSQLDGIPLAIELAAARIKVLTVEKIYERLNDRFNLLTGGKRTALPRQQTLKALIDWSYGLLSEQEKLLWSRLTVFNDGWTLESAEKICPYNKIAVNEVIDLLSLLVEKSIIIFNEENERYNILETLRQYGEEKLEEKNALLSKHLHYYVEFAESAEPKLAGPEALVWLDKLETEHGNLQSAVERVLKGGISEDGARLAGALGLFWDIRGYHSTGRLLLESMLENSKGISKAAVAKLLNRAGTLCRNQGDYQQAFNYYEESLALYQEVNDKNGISKCIHNMGVVAFEQGEYEHAREILEKHLAVNRKTGDKENIAYALNELGNMAYDQGDYERAQKLHTESLALRKQTGNKRGVSNSLNNLGNVMTNRGDYENAMKLYKESLDIKRELGDKRGITTALHNFGLLHHYKGDYDLAKTYLEQSITLARDVGDKQGIAETLYELGSIEYKLANYEHAKKFYDESLEIRREIGNKLGMLYCIMGLADVAGLKDDHYRAARLLGFVDSAFNSMKTVFERGDLLKYENAVERLRNVLGEEKYYNYSEEGKKLTLEQAAEIALKDS
jgi:predicted ATPase/Tfp pilus assembly protein PilF